MLYVLKQSNVISSAIMCNIVKPSFSPHYSEPLQHREACRVSQAPRLWSHSWRITAVENSNQATGFHCLYSDCTERAVQCKLTAQQSEFVYTS